MLNPTEASGNRPIRRGVLLGTALLLLSASTVLPHISPVGKSAKKPKLAPTPSSSVAVKVQVVPAPEIPTVFFLDQNYPNPSSTSTTIRYGLPEPAWTTIMIYDIRGRQLQTLVNRLVEPGYHSVRWDAKGHVSGVYLCSIVAGPFRATRKIVLVK